MALYSWISEGLPPGIAGNAFIGTACSRGGLKTSLVSSHSLDVVETAEVILSVYFNHYSDSYSVLTIITLSKI